MHASCHTELRSLEGPQGKSRASHPERRALRSIGIQLGQQKGRGFSVCWKGELCSDSNYGKWGGAFVFLAPGTSCPIYASGDQCSESLTPPAHGLSRSHHDLVEAKHRMLGAAPHRRGGADLPENGHFHSTWISAKERQRQREHNKRRADLARTDRNIASTKPLVLHLTKRHTHTHGATLMPINLIVSCPMWSSAT